jgi:hypothetical protein
MRYRIYPGTDCQASGRCITRIEVSWSEDAGGGETARSGGDGASKGEKGRQASAQDAEELNERLSPWLFTVPKWQHKAFITDAAALLKLK